MPPRYLFRAASEDSRGINSQHSVDPAPCHQYHESIDGMSHEQAHQMLKAHFKWWYLTTSEFSSWSCSLLWVLVHAVRKRDSRGEGNVLVYIIDTSKLLRSRIHKALDLLHTYDLDNEPFLLEYCVGEYLIHGKLEDAQCLRSVSLDTLSDFGLFEVVPELNDRFRRHLLYQQVKHLRIQIRGSAGTFSAEQYAAVRQLGNCFGGDFSLPVKAAFVSLRNPSLYDDDIPDIISLMEDEERLGVRPVPVLENEDFYNQGIPEADQLHTILQIMFDHVETQLSRQRHRTQVSGIIDDKYSANDVAELMGKLTVVDAGLPSPHAASRKTFHVHDSEVNSSSESDEDPYEDEPGADKDAVHIDTARASPENETLIRYSW